jgi:hypothetical protein
MDGNEGGAINNKHLPDMFFLSNKSDGFLVVPAESYAVVRDLFV